MTNGEKLKDLFNKFFPGVMLNEGNLADCCWLFKCPVTYMSEEELAKLSENSGSPCNGCSYDNWWEQEYKEPTVEYFEGDAEATKDYMEMLKTMGLFELKEINQKTKEMINAAYGNKGFGRAEGSDQFITKENEGGF